MDNNLTINDLYPSRFLKVEDIGDDDLILTIDSIEIMQLGDSNEEKPVLYFREIKKGLVLNVTNGKTIAKNFGDKVAGWIDKRISLYKTEVEFAGRTQLGIRIRLRPTKKLAPPPLPQEPEEFDENFEPEF